MRTSHKGTARGFGSRNRGLLLWLAGLLLLAGVIGCPVSLPSTRALVATLAASMAVGALILWWRVRGVRWSLLAALGLGGAFMALPGRENYNRFELRGEVAQAAARYEGARQMEGGENGLGMDGPGLVRRGAVDGLARHGLRTANPHLLRLACAVWWRDLAPGDWASGRVRGIRKVCEAPSLEILKGKNLHPGDFAVTRDGRRHILVYLGGHVWMEADPVKRKVTRLRLGRDQSAGLQAPVTVARWRWLELPKR